VPEVLEVLPAVVAPLIVSELQVVGLELPVLVGDWCGPRVRSKIWFPQGVRSISVSDSKFWVT